MRIGELSQRTGVSVHTLRAWERRYQLLQPRRSGGGTRLYAALDEARIFAALDALTNQLRKHGRSGHDLFPPRGWSR